MPELTSEIKTHNVTHEGADKSQRTLESSAAQAAMNRKDPPTARPATFGASKNGGTDGNAGRKIDEIKDALARLGKAQKEVTVEGQSHEQAQPSNENRFLQFADDRGIKFAIGDSRVHTPTDARTDQEIYARYKTVRNALVPQEKDGRVTNFGGLCRAALRELETAAGDPSKWTLEDLKSNQAISDLFACYQGFGDLRDNRTMHGPQERALKRLVDKQKEMDSQHGGTHKTGERLAHVARAFEDGIGAEETPVVNTRRTERAGWIRASDMKSPEEASGLLDTYKSSLESSDRGRYASVQVTHKSKGVPLNARQRPEEEKKSIIRELIESIIASIKRLYEQAQNS